MIKALTTLLLSLTLYAPQPAQSNANEGFKSNLLAQASQNKKTENMSEKEFRKRVREAVFEACNNTAPIKDTNTRKESCECYSKKYEKRYTTQTLVDINSWSNKNQENAEIVVIMMSPEAAKCGII